MLCWCGPGVVSESSPTSATADLTARQVLVSGRTSALEVADQIILAVKRKGAGGGRGDTAGQLMHGAYLRTVRRFQRIRELAAQGAGDETLILTRSLLSLVAVRLGSISHPNGRTAAPAGNDSRSAS